MNTNTEPKKFSAITSNGGIVLCEKEQGAFLAIKYPQEITDLIKLLNKLSIV